MSEHDSEEGRTEEEPRVVIRDRRRIDPETGEARHDDSGPLGNAGDSVAGDLPATEAGALETELAERTADLQRVTAEYANYRRRVERDRSVASELATAAVLTALLPVLDNLERAAAHGDLQGAFKATADELQGTLERVGLRSFGEKGDPFDPVWHEAVHHAESPDVSEPTCVDVMRRGYALGERMLRPAMVAVADPSGDVVDVESSTVDSPTIDTEA